MAQQNAPKKKTRVKLLSYIQKDTWIDRLCGVTKLIFFLSWTLTSMLTYDTRVLAIMLCISFLIFYASKTSLRQIGKVLGVIIFFLCVNLIAIFAFSPYQGTALYGTKTVLVDLPLNHDLTAEQLFYEMNIVLKYLTIVPSVFIFLITTNPSEFAASLNRIGVSYYAGYSVSIALRYIPDVQDSFANIQNAQAARGIEMSGKAPLLQRIKNTAAILFPLIFTSMDRIDVISHAMELRGFGKNKKRTWYMGRPLQRNDYLVIAFTIIFCAAALIFTYYDGSRFYNPFI